MGLAFLASAALLAAVGGASASAGEPQPAAATPTPEVVSGDPTYAGKILWQGLARREALFLPQSVLDNTPFDELPLSEVARRSVLWSLGLETSEFNEYMERPKERFLAAKAAPEKSSSAGALPLHSLVETMDVPFLGEIVAVVDGLQAVGGYTAQAVHVRGDQVIQDRRHQVRPGMIVAEVRAGGSIKLAGKKLRAEAPPGQEDIRKEATVLIGGNLLDNDSRTLAQTFLLIVRAGMIQPSATLNLTDELPKPLGRLLEEYEGDPLAEVYP